MKVRNHPGVRVSSVTTGVPSSSLRIARENNCGEQCPEIIVPIVEGGEGGSEPCART